VGLFYNAPERTRASTSNVQLSCYNSFNGTAKAKEMLVISEENMYIQIMANISEMIPHIWRKYKRNTDLYNFN